MSFKNCFFFLVLFCFCFFESVKSDSPVAATTWVVNLDLPPSQRWPWKEMLPVYNDSIHEAVGLIGEFVPRFFEPVIEDLAVRVLPYIGEYADEIRAGAKILGLSLGTATLLNIIYEVEAGCTSIVAQDLKGEIFHGRNLDFNLAKVLRKIVIDVVFKKNNKILYRGTSYAGYVGLLTGMRPGGFAISLDQRDSGYILENLLEALFVKGTYAVCFLIRDTLQNVDHFEKAVDILANTSLVTTSYLTVSGTKAGEGAVITRDRRKAVDVWRLDAGQGRWYLVETNFDHWKPAGDHRRETAEKAMDAIGSKSIDLQGIFHVLSTPPVLNGGTTYTTLMSAQSGDYSSWIRNE